MTRANAVIQGTPSPLPSPIEEAADWQRLLSDALARPVRIVSIARRPSPFATLFPAEIVSVATADGKRIELFVKHLDARQADHPSKQRRDRELRVYESLLTDPRLPVPRYYGARRDLTGGGGGGQLFLEYIDDWNMKYHVLELWFEAARELARLHAHFAARADQLYRSEFLLRVDAAYLHDWADRAMGVVRKRSVLAATVLEPVFSRYEHVTHLLQRRAPTLLHNDLSPKNVIADRRTSPARICFVDWEMAGIGCGLLDLVQLKDGLDPAADQKMVDAYCEALAGTGLRADDRVELDRLLAACEIHVTAYRLARSTNWDLPLETVEQWCARVRQAMERVLGPSR